MKHTTGILGVLILAAVVCTTAATAATPITGCTVITAPGSYYLKNDILNAACPIAIDVRAPYVTIDGMNRRIDGKDAPGSFGIRIRDRAHVTIRNVVITDWNCGVYGENADYATLDRVKVQSNYYGSEFYSSDYLNVKSSTATANKFGVTLSGSSRYGRIIGSTITYQTSGSGIRLMGAPNAQVQSCTIQRNSLGVYLYSSGSNTLTKNRIEYNTNGVYNDFSSGARVYNNLLRNTINVHSSDFIQLNIVKTAGTNIMGGPSIGGNFWANPSGTGWSQTHADANHDGFTDLPYLSIPGTSGSFDKLPLHSWP